MAASKARHIEKVWRDENVVLASVLSASDIFETQRVSDLPRVEQIKVATLVGATRPASAANWLSCDEIALLAAIDAAVNGSVHYATDTTRDEIIETREIERSTVVDRYAERDETARANNNRAAIDNADAAKLAELIGKLAGGSVDRDEVTRMVDDRLLDALADLETRLSEQLSRPIVHSIEIAGRAPREIGGHQHAQFADMVRMVGARLHVYLVGPPGTGKTTLAHQAATALDLPFSAISLGPTTPASQVWGYSDANGVYHRTLFRDAYEHGGVFLFDEIDNGHAGIIATVNQALANGECAFPDGMVVRSDDFVCIAAANTYGTGATNETVGRNALDAATLDRFVMLEVPIDEDLETVLAHAQCDNAPMVDELLKMIRGYRAAIASAKLKLFVSPRAAIDGAKMIRAGFSLDQIRSMRILRNVPDDQMRKLAASIDGGY
jgi:hypothetical protein